MSVWPVGCFAGRRVLVTGGTSGIGAAVAGAANQDHRRVLAEAHGLHAALDFRNEILVRFELVHEALVVPVVHDLRMLDIGHEGVGIARPADVHGFGPGADVEEGDPLRVLFLHVVGLLRRQVERQLAAFDFRQGGPVGAARRPVGGVGEGGGEQQADHQQRFAERASHQAIPGLLSTPLSLGRLRLTGLTVLMSRR